jgi:hypothetical protein
LRGRGYSDDPASPGALRMRLQLRGIAGFPQIYILGPDRHVIEINAAQL